MCGIAGIFDPRGRQAADAAVLDRMTDSLAHRGPDDRGTWIDGPVGLGHRRLSIIDLAAGHQPLFNEDGRVAIVFNGEIYNFQPLMEELKAAGHQFRTRSDTEVIVHAWEQWGEACVERLRGMFAFAIWDGHRQALFIARDRIGIKPLFYAELPDGRVLFGSELKALLAHPGLPREIEPRAVEEYFAYGYVPEPRTIYRHARKLPPGHTLTVRAGEAVGAPRQYWDLRFAPEAGLDAAATEERLRERLAEAVESHLVADVPVGAFLSGGVDSSAVVATMAGLVEQPVHTTSISFGESAYDEARYAAEVAERYGTDHHVRRLEPDDFQLLDRLAGLYDEPYADSSAMPTFRVSELAREGVKVVLSGDGGDENFAGYRRYRWHLNEERVRRLLPRALRGPVFGLAGRLYPKADWAPKVLRAKATLEALALDSVEAYFHSVSIVGEPLARRLFNDAFRRELDGYRAVEVMQGHAANGPDHPLSAVQYLDFKTYLPGDILTKVDRASMAHGLEVRVPLLDHEFVEWAATVPPALKLQGRDGKHVLKRAMRPMLSEGLMYRPKMGFAVPLAEWFRGPLRGAVRSSLLGERLADVGWFDTAFLRRVVREHEAGLRDYSALIWSLLMFERALAGADRSAGAAAEPMAMAGGR
ncbi:XrtA/PEP-CTERM system amidotransferase [Sediminicurvatus halobius]|uniref:asparagine synthase (glutamine-hydrolyzing) n=1 Tax=Sediminicurvatus halobius TaxID=2182432 RepID=A0A2U2N0U4_9GAMM|nr:XrtA/PEP-CTERM system amidotransferase [Spiribacter halobius]PWG62682.1 asparagine synthetase B [Spiribacter halobius]UEX77351.1 amidotransferase 1, exosortase A system-associated [Spiribacter halobius]